MKPRIIFGFIILIINLLIINFFQKIELFSQYEIELKILIPFLSLLFLEPIIDYFQVFNLYVEHTGNENSENPVLCYNIHYTGKNSASFKVKIPKLDHNVSFSINKNEEEINPEDLLIKLSPQNPNIQLRYKILPPYKNIEKISFHIYSFSIIKIKIKSRL